MNITNIKKAIFLTAIGIVACLPIAFNSPPKALNSNAVDTLFSAHRAFDHVSQIAKSPHSIGTDEHANVRNYIIDQCSKLGLAPKIQDATSIRTFDGYVLAGNIKNVVAVLKGRESTQAIVLMSHYDSKSNTPGAGDDAAGVASMLETARILAKHKPLKNDVIFLFTDGEESGLLGANAFVSENPLCKNVQLAINLDARGNTGVSIMFETSNENGWLIREYAKCVTDPVANSLSFEIYKNLPNSTDYTIFKDAGIAGLNHAFIDGFVNYHNTTDTPENLNLNSLQHHGENMVNLAKHFGDIDFTNAKEPNVSYFNVIGSWFVYYSGYWNLPFLILSICLVIALIVFGFVRKRISLKGLILGFITFALLLVSGVFITLYAIKSIKWVYPVYDNFLEGNSYNSYYYFIALIGLGSMIIVQPLIWASRKFGIASMIAAILLFTMLVQIAVYSFVPTAMYIFFFPMASVAITQLIITIRTIHYENQPDRYSILALIGAIPGLLFIFSTIHLLFIAFGLTEKTSIIIVLFAVLSGFVLPLLYHLVTLNGLRITIILMTFTICALILAHLNSSYSVSKPLQTDIRYELDIDKKAALWVSNNLTTDAGNQALFLNPRIDSKLVWYGPQLVSDAPVIPLPFPELTILKDTIIDNLRQLKLHCSNPRKASAIIFDFNKDNDIRRIIVENKEVKFSPTSSPLTTIDFNGVPKEGLSLFVELRPGSFECWLKDEKVGLPQVADYQHYPSGTAPGAKPFSNTTMVKKHFTIQ